VQSRACGEASIINALYAVIQNGCEELLDLERSCVIDLCVLLLDDAGVLILPVQSDALSGALHKTSTEHCSEILRPRTQDCPRNPIKQAVVCCMSDPPT